MGFIASNKFHYGNLFSHLGFLLVCLNFPFILPGKPSEEHWRKMATVLSNDPFYKAIASEGIRSPVAQSPVARDLFWLLGHLENFRRDMESFSLHGLLFHENVCIAYRHFLNSYEKIWERHLRPYLIVPEPRPDAEPGGRACMHYIAPCLDNASKREPAAARPRFCFRVAGPGAAHRELCELADTTMAALSCANPLHLDSSRIAGDFSFFDMFGFHFQNVRAADAAFAALIAIDCLKAVLGDEFARVASPVPGTVVLGRIDAEGRITAPEGSEEALRAVRKEFGPAIPVVVPADANLPEDTPFDERAVKRVKSVDQLIAVVLGRDWPSG